MELEVVTGSYDGLVQGFSIDALDPGSEGLRRKFHEKDHSGCVKSMACGGRYLATGSTDETIKLYDMRKHTEIGTLLQQEGSITWLTFHKNRFLLSASEDGTICVWKCGESWECLATLTGHKYAVTCVSVHPSGKLALSVGKDRTVRTWDLTNFRQAFRLRLPKAAELVQWSPIGDQYALSVEKTITVYDVSTGESTAAFDVERPINCFIFIQDNVVAVGSEHPCIDLYSTMSGSLLARLEGHTKRVKALTLSPAADLLFSTSSDGTIIAWNLQEPLSKSKRLSSLDSGSRLTCMTIVSPSSLLKELKHPFRDPVGKGQDQSYESTNSKETAVPEEMLSAKMSSSQSEPESCDSIKTKRVKRSVAKRVSRNKTSQLVSGFETKQGKLSRRRLLIRKKHLLKRLSHKK